MDKKESEFMKTHLLVVGEMKKSLGVLCREIRLRNNLSREYVSERTGISERSIASVERKYTTSFDMVNALCLFYCKEGYITKEEQERSDIGCFL